MTTGLPRLADCRDCGDPIRFVELDTGKALPVNPLPDPGGNVAAQLAGGRLYGFVISRDKQPRPTDQYRFRPHHATCTAVERKPSRPVPEPDPALF